MIIKQLDSEEIMPQSRLPSLQTSPITKQPHWSQHWSWSDLPLLGRYGDVLCIIVSICVGGEGRVREREHL